MSWRSYAVNGCWLWACLQRRLHLEMDFHPGSVISDGEIACESRAILKKLVFAFLFSSKVLKTTLSGIVVTVAYDRCFSPVSTLSPIISCWRFTIYRTQIIENTRYIRTEIRPFFQTQNCSDSVNLTKPGNLFFHLPVSTAIQVAQSFWPRLQVRNYVYPQYHSPK